MPVRTYKPTSAGRRKMSVSDFAEITRSGPEPSLVEGHNKTGGRNHYGRVTSWHRGGGHKRLYRRIDFRRDKVGVPAKVAAIEYDPNRSANIALLHYKDGVEQRFLVLKMAVERQLRDIGIPCDLVHGGAREAVLKKALSRCLQYVGAL